VPEQRRYMSGSQLYTPKHTVSVERMNRKATNILRL
jgi:hypothetical protein